MGSIIVPDLFACAALEKALEAFSRTSREAVGGLVMGV
jgi:hypothetical protein